MSKEVDNRVVEMRFDNTDFEKNCDNTLKSLDKLDNALKFKDAQKGFDELERSSEKVNFGGLSGSIDSVSVKLDMMQAVAIGVLTNIANKAVESAAVFAKSLSVDQVLAGWGKYEEKTSAVQMIVNQGYDLHEVEKQMEKLNWFTDETSYNFTDMANNIGKFTAQGQDLGLATTAMEGISTWAATAGAGINGASRAMYNLSQALGTGSVKLQDWMSIENANMGTMKFKETVIETAKELGKLDQNGSMNFDNFISNGKYSGEKTVDTTNFRTTLSSGWFDTDVLMATLEKYGKFTDELNKATEETGLTATEMLRYIEKYKSGSIDLASVTGENANAIKKYISELSESEYELGYNAFKAAQEAKTFTEAITATKDAVSTAWMNVFQTIFGGYDTARTLWTDLANGLYDIFAEPVNGLNELFSEAFTSGWDGLLGNLTDSTIISAEDFATTLQEVGLKNHRVTQSMIDDAGSLYDSFKYGWATTDVMTETIDLYINKLKSMSSAELEAAGYTRDDIKQLQLFRKELVTSGSEVDNLVSSLGKATARDNFIDAFWNIFNSLKGVIQAIKEGFREIFPPKTADDILNFSERIKELTERLNLFNDDGETLNETGIKLKDTFKGLFAVFGIVKDILNTVFQILSPVFGATNDLGGSVLTLTANIGNWLASLREWIKESEAFNTIVGWLTAGVQFLVDVVKLIYEEGSKVFKWLNENVFSVVIEWLDKFIGKFKNDGNETVSILDRIKGIIEGILTVIGNVYIAITNFFKKVSEKLKNSEAWNKVVDFFKRIKEGLQNIWKFLGEKAKDGSLFDWLKKLAAGVVLIEIIKRLTWFSEYLKDFIKSLRNVSYQFSQLMTDIRDTLWSFQKKINSKTLIKMAKAVLLLAIAIAVLASIPSIEQAIVSLGIVVALMGAMLGFIKILDKMELDGKKIRKAAQGLMPLAIAILLVASSAAIIGSIDTDKMLGVGLLLAEIVSVLVGAALTLDKLSKNSGAIIKGASGILIFSVAIEIVALSAKTLAKLDEEQLKRSGEAILVFIAAMTVAALALGEIQNGGSVIKGASGILIFSVAIGILALATKALGKLDEDQLKRSGLAIVAFIGSMTLAAMLLSVIDGGSVVKAASGILIFSVAIEIIAIAAKTLSKLDEDEMKRSGIFIAALVGAMVIAAGALSLVDGGRVVKAASGLLVLSVAFELLAITARTLSKMNPEQMKTAGIGIAALTAVIVILAEVLSNIDSTALLKSSAALLILGVAIAELSVSLAILSILDTKGLIVGAVAIAAVVAVFVVLGKIAGNSSVALIKFAAAIAIFGAAITLIGAGLLAAAGAIKIFVDVLIEFSEFIAKNPLALLDGIKTLLNGIKEAAITAVKNFIEGIKEAVKYISEVFHELKEPIKQFLSDFFEILLDLVPKVITIVKEIVIEACLAIKEASPYVKDAIVQVIGDSLRGVIEVLPILAELVITLVLETCRIIKETSGAVVDTITELILKLIDQALTLMPKFTELLIALTNSLCDTLLKTAPKVNATVTTLILGLLTEISKHIEQVVELGIQIAINLINGIANKIGDVIQAGVNLVLKLIQGIADALNDEENQERFRKAFVDLIVGVIRTVFTSFQIISDIGKKAWEFMKSVWRDHIKPKFEEIKSKVKEIGHNIIEGIKEGIHDKIESLKAKCKEVTDAITGKIKNLLNIHSPSKVMAEIGKYTIMGMAQGIDKNASKAVNSMENLGNSMIDTTSTIAYKIAQALDQDMDISPTITPIMDLSQIQNGVGSINSMIGGTRGINGTISIASRATNGFNATMGSKNAEAIRIAEATGSSKAFNNTFNITGNNPKEIANEVSRIIAKQVERKNDQWA